MKSNKSKKIILISIILILIIIILLGIAYIYFATDLLKSSKQTFYKYTMQAFDQEKGYIPTNLTQYFVKMQNTPYQNNGQISCTLSGGQNEQQYDTINQFNISFSGLIDSTNSDFDENISLNYSPEVNFPFAVRKKGDIIGLQSQYVGSKFIAQSINGLTQGLININTSTNQNSTEQVQSLSANELINIYNKYVDVINQQLPDEKFSKVTQNNQTGYKLTLTSQDINNLAIAILETLQSDEETLNLINQYTPEDITSNDINQIVQSMNSTSSSASVEETTFDIILYPVNNQLSKIQIVSGDLTVEINKENISNGQKYTIVFLINQNGNTGTITFTIEYTGLDTLQAVNENYTLQINSISEVQTSQINDMTFRISNTNTFVQNGYIEEFTDDNSLLLDEYDQSQVDALMNSIGERILEVNRDQMNELGLSEMENPLVSFIPTIVGASIYNQAQSTVENDAMSEIEVSTFNMRFEQYASSNLKGATARGLMTVIENNNSSASSEDEKIQEIHFDGAEYEATDENILLIKSSIEVDSNYNVEFEKDPVSGRIYRVVINKR